MNSGEDEIPALPTDERVRLEYLYRGKRCLEHSVGYRKGERIIISQGPLIGHEGEIVYFNRHNREATIEIEMFGTKTTIRVALEITNRI